MGGDGLLRLLGLLGLFGLFGLFGRPDRVCIKVFKIKFTNGILLQQIGPVRANCAWCAYRINWWDLHNDHTISTLPVEASWGHWTQ